MKRLLVTQRGESGFTLIELLVAITLLGIVMIPLAGAMMAGLLTTGEAQTRLEETTSTLFTSAFWADDVQSADTITRSGPACDGSGPSVVTFAWATGATGSDGTSAASYVVRERADGGRQVVRVLCGPSPSTGTVAPRLGAGDPQVRCDPTCEQPRQVKALPATVTITMTTPKGFEFSVIGTRRSTWRD